MERVRQPIQVLHIDDEPGVLDVTGRLLEANDERITVTSFQSTASALDQVDGADCLVADYVMPEMDGAELVGRVRESNPELPIVFFTGHDAEDLAPETFDDGPTDHIRKGADADQYTTLCESIVNLVETVRSCTRTNSLEPTAES